MRTGIGYDVHKFKSGRDLFLGGVKIEYKKGLDGHSDADVLLHAICDALLSAAALGDIGKHFPDTDDKYKGISSLELLKECALLLKEHGFKTVNVGAVVVAQAPKIAPYVEKMKENIANALIINTDDINIAGTTEEGLGFTGKYKGIKAYATCLIDNI
ncbi:MAG: 2-C-methyl-D-erythritol 2,4-cyclodiphosphate synthase [Oscillospiraceae bacterium]|nr:2-C-methyl-D-erythritol 2,4-cyclodiphosphate synthase [Candidatus Equicaccousia limihippi]